MRSGGSNPLHASFLREPGRPHPDLIRTKINLLPEGITVVRIVEIAGLDVQADGGTHVAHARGLAYLYQRLQGKGPD